MLTEPLCEGEILPTTDFMIKYDKLSNEQISLANTLIQRLVNGVNNRWSNKPNGLNSLQCYEIIEQIYEILNKEQNENNEYNNLDF